MGNVFMIADQPTPELFGCCLTTDFGTQVTRLRGLSCPLPDTGLQTQVLFDGTFVGFLPPAAL
jgi:hypothetical protein